MLSRECYIILRKYCIIDDEPQTKHTMNKYWKIKIDQFYFQITTNLGIPRSDAEFFINFIREKYPTAPEFYICNNDKGWGFNSIPTPYFTAHQYSYMGEATLKCIRREKLQKIFCLDCDCDIFLN